MDLPIIAIIGADGATVKSILSNIRKTSNDSNTQNFENLTLYIHDISTKYYSTKVALLPIEDISSLTDSLKSKLEGLLIHFNSHDRTFLERLPTYVDFAKANPVELFILLCSELMDDCKSGITFKCIKDCYHKIDIIELDKSSCDDHVEGAETSGYEELSEALKCTLWSSVQHADSSDVIGFKNSLFYSEEEEGDADGVSIESEINNFENLLSQVMQFRSNTTSMSRDDRLNSAQHFAEVFEKLLLQDEEKPLNK